MNIHKDIGLNYKKGISIIEVIVASVIISLSVISISVVYGNLVSLSLENTKKVQAAFLLDEGVEIIKTMRNESWSNISNISSGSINYFIWNGNVWKSTTTAPSLIDNTFTRTFVVSPVYRDVSTFNILPDTSGLLDAGTKKIDISVSWLHQGATSTKNITTYIFNLYE